MAFSATAACKTTASGPEQASPRGPSTSFVMCPSRPELIPASEYYKKGLFSRPNLNLCADSQAFEIQASPPEDFSSFFLALFRVLILVLFSFYSSHFYPPFSLFLHHDCA